MYQFIVKSWLSRLQSAVFALLFSFAHLSSSAPLYRYLDMPYGDTDFYVDVNDNGLALVTGFCDFACGARTLTIGDEIGSFKFVPGYSGDSSGYVRATAINNHGDIFGDATRGGAYVPTIWKDGKMFDLTEPANANLQFDYDSGPQSIPFSLYDLAIMNLPSSFLRDAFGRSLTTPRNSALTNSRGDLLFEFSRFGAIGDSYAALVLVVPEPAPLGLVALPTLGLLLAFSTRRRRLALH